MEADSELNEVQMQGKGRTALLIRCSEAEARIIQTDAEAQRRTLGAYVMSIMDIVLRSEERLFQGLGSMERYNEVVNRNRVRVVSEGPRGEVLLRLSKTDSDKIRMAAKMRDLSISDFVMKSLRRAWAVREH